MCNAIASGNADAAFKAVHALKGKVGNLSLTKLYDDMLPLVEELRGGSLNNAEVLLEPVKNDYDQIVNALRE